MNYEQLCKDSYEIAKDHGFWDGPTDGYAIQTLLMQSEISEALEDYRNGHGLAEVWYEGENKKPCGVPSELADVVIRIANFCGKHGLELNPDFDDEFAETRSFEDALALATNCISTAYIVMVEDKEWSEEDKTFIGELLSTAVAYIEDICKNNGVDLEKIVLEKQEYNRSRPHKHGGKRF